VRLIALLRTRGPLGLNGDRRPGASGTRRGRRPNPDGNRAGDVKTRSSETPGLKAGGRNRLSAPIAAQVSIASNGGSTSRPMHCTIRNIRAQEMAQRVVVRWLGMLGVEGERRHSLRRRGPLPMAPKSLSRTSTIHGWKRVLCRRRGVPLRPWGLRRSGMETERSEWMRARTQVR